MAGGGSIGESHGGRSGDCRVPPVSERGSRNQDVVAIPMEWGLLSMGSRPEMPPAKLKARLKPFRAIEVGSLEVCGGWDGIGWGIGIWGDGGYGWWGPGL